MIVGRGWTSNNVFRSSFTGYAYDMRHTAVFKSVIQVGYGMVYDMARHGV